MVLRNGHMPLRELVIGLGPKDFKQLRVDIRNVLQYGEVELLSSSILQRYMQRVVNSIISVVLALYLSGISTNDLSVALSVIMLAEAKKQ